MLSRKELKQLSKNQLRGHWKMPILVSIGVFLIQLAMSLIAPNNYGVVSFLFSILSLAVGSYIVVAICKFYLKFAENADNSNLKHLKVSFNVALKSFVVNLILGIPIFIVAIFISIGIILGVESVIITYVRLVARQR